MDLNPCKVRQCENDTTSKCVQCESRVKLICEELLTDESRDHIAEANDKAATLPHGTLLGTTFCGVSGYDYICGTLKSVVVL